MFDLPRSHAKAFGLTLLLILLSATVLHAQRGRSWVNGLVFGGPETQALAGATVTLTGDPGSEQLRDVKAEAHTDEEGKYYFKGLVPGDYTFRVTAPGFAPYEVPVFVAPDTLTALHVKLRKEASQG